jgi:hypothetical protein
MAEEVSTACETDVSDMEKQATVVEEQCQFFTIDCQPCDDEVAAVLNDAYQSWHFDAFKLAEITGNRPLSTLGLYLFDRLGLTEEFRFDAEKLEQFFLQIEDGYDEANEYHNRAHAASVLHAMHALLENGGVAKTIEAGCPRGSGKLQTLACLLAAAVHDHEHLGVNNDFLVRTRHERARVYNDQHVNENHHVASAFAVLNRPECNFVENMTDEDFRVLRGVIIQLVLGTDMAKHQGIQESFSQAFSVSSDVAPEHRVAVLLQMAMKCADLGHLALNWDVHEKWVANVEAEFFAQGDKERSAGLPVSYMMDRNQPGCSKTQPGFFEFVALPLLRSMVSWSQRCNQC